MDSHFKEISQHINSGKYPNIHAVLISRGSEILYENYFSGTDRQSGVDIGEMNCSADYLHDVCSISKLVVTSCIGIAIERGEIKGIHQHIRDFFPALIQPSDKRKCKITVDHLLSMTSGLVWNEPAHSNDPTNSELLMLQEENPIQFVLQQPVDIEPGTEWRYNGGNTQLLAEIILQTSGLPIDEYAKRHLFDPLGIDRFEWTSCHKSNRPAAASGLRLRALDMLKLGQLYAASGKYGGQSILTESWVINSLANKVDRSNTESYGYAFWRWEDSIEEVDVNFMAAPGNGDQRIYLDDQSGLVIAVLAGNYDQWEIENNSYKLLKDFVYPNFT